jgi:predicted  nucleic acid-binding Zn-ribbon protein
MADQPNSESIAAATGSGDKREDQLDLAGQNILRVLHKAAGLAEENSRVAVNIAQKLSNQLYVVENRVAELEKQVAELEAEAQLYREKAERSEQWLQKISSELEQQVV